LEKGGNSQLKKRENTQWNLARNAGRCKKKLWGGVVATKKTKWKREVEKKIPPLLGGGKRDFPISCGLCLQPKQKKTGEKTMPGHHIERGYSQESETFASG